MGTVVGEGAGVAPSAATAVQDQPVGQPAPDVSVVIPALNAAHTLGVQLDALARQVTDRTFEVLLADNGSTDGTRELVEGYRDRLPGVRWIDASARTGSNVARNTGIAAARSDVVLLCDADDEVDPHWVEAMAVALEDADGVGGRLDRVKLNDAYIQNWGTPHGHNGVVAQLGFLPRPIGANAGLRKSVWERLGGFDESYVRGGTETEFFWRLQLEGFSLVEVPDALVHYRMRSSFKAGVRQMYIWGRQAPMLYRDFRSRGMTWDRRETLRRLRWLVTTAPTAHRGRDVRYQLAREAAYRAGRVVGSVSFRVVYL